MQVAKAGAIEPLAYLPASLGKLAVRITATADADLVLTTASGAAKGDDGEGDDATRLVYYDPTAVPPGRGGRVPEDVDGWIGGCEECGSALNFSYHGMRLETCVDACQDGLEFVVSFLP